MNKRLLLGDEAIALGALHAGLSGVYAYPGTPSTEITEFIQGDPLARERGVHSRWSTNEKTAMEEALGMSFMGKRALVCMKHVGLNVCADPFVNSGMTGVNGGVVVLVADDPSMHSSQDEQDSRFYGKFAMIPTFEPSSQQEAYDMMAVAFDYSERVCLPVLMRVTTRMAHSRAVVECVDEPRQQNELNYNAVAANWVLLPANARRRNDKVTAQQQELEDDAANSTYNIYNEGHDRSMGILASGIGFPMIVRMPSLQREHVQKYLDAGAEGVWVPMLETREQAEELVRLSKYAPLGQRGISTMRPHSDYAPGKLTEYMEKANGHTMAFAQIETRRAVENAEEIAAVEGLDGLFIGPNDLACDLGCTGRFDTPEMDAAVSHVLAAAKAHGKPCGIVASNPAYLRRWAEQGMTMFSCDSELGLLKKGIQGMVSSVGLT